MAFVGVCDGCRVALSDENSTAIYQVQDWLEWSEPGGGDGHEKAYARAVIEVSRLTGGRTQRAMLGGEIRLQNQTTNVIRVGQSSGLTHGAEKTCQSELSDPLVPGLPSEFAQGALDGIIRVAVKRPPGSVTIIDRAGYDEVNSSPFAFEFAGELLMAALAKRLGGEDLVAAALKELAKQRNNE